MKKTFSKSDICMNVIEHINCDDEMIEQTIIGMLAPHYSKDSQYKFNYPNDDTIEVEIIDDNKH